ncbi:transglutaminase domain-containing protein [uncultured Clostridium sp.]|uniref:transglutaminase domain-containing protein n=1 Tax=uncultured Clostridium sp. TaxID=59620 RepID=UPI0025CBEEBA|nr:transglutaminase domain-containing protein [uncultured Clostridium sp.]
MGKINSKCKKGSVLSKILIIVSIIFIVIAGATIFTLYKYKDNIAELLTVVEDKKSYSEEAVESFINDVITTKKNKKVYFENPGITEEEFKNSWNSFIEKDPKVNYYLEDCTYNYYVKNNIIYIETTFNFKDDRVPFNDIYVVNNDKDTMKYIIDTVKTGAETLTVYVKDNAMPFEDLQVLFETAPWNDCEDVVLTSMDRSYLTYGDVNSGEYILEVVVEDINNDTAVKCKEEVTKSLDNIIAKLNIDGKSDKEKYREIYKVICNNISYDDDMSDVIVNEDFESDLNLYRQTYGALVRGKTVCTGYATAFKAICDRINLPCWVVFGTAEGEEHAWNSVILDGEVKYIDATWGDQDYGVEYKYFLMSKGTAEVNNRTIDDDYYMPEEFQ